MLAYPMCSQFIVGFLLQDRVKLTADHSQVDNWFTFAIVVVP